MERTLGDDVDNPLVERLCRFIDTPSISGQERAFLELLESELRDSGYRIERQPVERDRWNLVALPKNPPQLLFATHIDVVPPHIPAKVVEGRVMGRGASDTKGGLVAMLAAADRIDPAREHVGFLLVVGEEVDHIGAIRAVELDLKPRAIILCEPTEGKVGAGQKGLLKIDLRSSGEAAHSAFPELGKDALGPLLDSLEAIRNADYPVDDVLGPTTLNIGLLEAGVAANVTPAEASATIVYRAVTEPDALLEFVRGLCHPEVEVSSVSANPPVVFDPVPNFETTVIAFNTDAWYLAPMAPVCLMGPGDIRRAHGDDEFIYIDEMVKGVDEYVRLAGSLIPELA